MTTLGPDRWRLVSAHLDQALDMPEAQRAEWLASLTDDNPALAADLRALLDEHTALADERFLEGNAVLPGVVGYAEQTVGAYTLVSPIGEVGWAACGSPRAATGGSIGARR